MAVASLCIDALVYDLYQFQFEIDGREAWKDKITALNHKTGSGTPGRSTPQSDGQSCPAPYVTDMPVYQWHTLFRVGAFQFGGIDFFISALLP